MKLNDDTSWMSQARCLDMDPGIFNPDRGRNIPQEAKDACRECPVADACRAYAVADPAITGYWGGTTYAERRELRKLAGFDYNASGAAKRTKPINHGTHTGYRAHLRRNIPPCDKCRAANAAYVTERRLAKMVSA